MRYPIELRRRQELILIGVINSIRNRLVIMAGVMISSMARVIDEIVLWVGRIGLFKSIIKLRINRIRLLISRIRFCKVKR